MNGKLVRSLAVVGLGLAIWFSPVPAGVKLQAWHLFAIFAATILGFIIQPLPMGTMAIFGVTASMLLHVLKPAAALSGFSNSTIWLIVSAFLFAKGFVKTGLGKRVAYLIMRAIGDSTLKLGYVMALSDFIISPATPASAARGGGVIFPVARSLCSAFDSEPGPTARRIGSYLIMSSFQANVITSSIFLTSCAVNSLMTVFAKQILNIQISWGTWALAGLVPGGICLALMPYVLYKLYPPEITRTPEAKEIAKRELEKMGPLSYAEKAMLLVFIGALLLWCTATITKLAATAIALLGVCVMLATKIIEYKDVIEEKGSWDALIWMGSLTSLATGLTTLGLIPWFAKTVGASMAGIPWTIGLAVLGFVYMYSHYGFASMAAHVTAIYPAFLTVAAATGAPPMLAMMSLAFLSTLCGGITHYASGSAPVYFGPGYVSQADWWRLGLILSIIYVLVFFTIGLGWWKVLGIW